MNPAAILRAASKQWFLIALACALAIGAWRHAALKPLVDEIPRDLVVAAVMLCMSAPLDLRSSLRGRDALLAVAIGVFVNTALAGPAAWLGGRVLIEPLAVGLVVAALAPCTLASAAVWVRRGGGNEAVSLAVTVVTNTASFLTLPTMAWLLLGHSRQVDGYALATRLFAIVVLPIALGQALRRSGRFRDWAATHRTRLSLAAQFGLLTMVLIGAVSSGEALADPAVRLGAADWFALTAAAAVVHVGLFAAGWGAARGCAIPRAEALAAGVAGSQKTLAVGLTVAMDFGPLAILPMIVYHALQLLIDAALVERLGPGRSAREASGPDRGLEHRAERA